MLASEQLLQLDTGVPKYWDPVKQLGKPSSSQGTELIPANTPTSVLRYQFHILLSAQKAKAQPTSYWHSSIALTWYFFKSNLFSTVTVSSFLFYSICGRKEGGETRSKNKGEYLTLARNEDSYFQNIFWWTTGITVLVFLWVRLVKKSERKVGHRSASTSTAPAQG